MYHIQYISTMQADVYECVLCVLYRLDTLLHQTGLEQTGLDYDPLPWPGFWNTCYYFGGVASTLLAELM